MRGTRRAPYTRTRSGSRARTARGQSRGQGCRIPGNDGTPARHRPAPAQRRSHRRGIGQARSRGAPGRNDRASLWLGRRGWYRPGARSLARHAPSMPAPSSSVEAQAWVVRGDGDHWPLTLGRAAELRWLSTRRRRGIARRRPPRQRLLPGKLRCKGDRLELAGLRRCQDCDLDQVARSFTRSAAQFVPQPLKLLAQDRCRCEQSGVLAAIKRF
jgi:hypothetical protein